MTDELLAAVRTQYTVIEKDSETAYRLVRCNLLKAEILESVSISPELATLLCAKMIDVCNPL